ncbi:MAG TPA: hypothetical protein VN604_03210 [Nitrospirota bacterium]|nr:hypothetical protein [Nitrospirota bacterium]
MRRGGKNEPDDEGWKFGEEWKEGSPDEPAGDEGVEYVELLRTDSGKGFTDSALLDLVSYLGSRGIRATYDSFSIGLEPAAMKTYVLKVEAGTEEEASRLLRKLMQGHRHDR